MEAENFRMNEEAERLLVSLLNQSAFSRKRLLLFESRKLAQIWLTGKQLLLRKKAERGEINEYVFTIMILSYYGVK